MNYIELDWVCGKFIDTDAERNEESYRVTTEHDGIRYDAIGVYFVNPRTFEKTLDRVEYVAENVFNRLANIFKP